MMSIPVTISDAEGAMRQACYTAEYYMNEAIDRIDRAFGEGYAKQNPILVAAFMQTAAEDLSSVLNRQGFADIADRLEYTSASTKGEL